MRRILSIWLCIMIISSSIVVILDIEQEVQAAPQVKVSNYTSRGSIIVESDADFTGANGVTGGTGVDGDPYIIEGWWINNTGPTSAISINFTDAHTVIKDCKITNISPSGGHPYGLFLREANNITVLNCRFSNISTGRGFDIIVSNNITIIDNEFTDIGGSELYYINDVNFWTDPLIVDSKNRDII